MYLSGDSARTLLQAEALSLKLLNADAGFGQWCSDERAPSLRGRVNPGAPRRGTSRPRYDAPKVNAAVTAFRSALLVPLPTGWRVQDVPR